MSTTVTEAALPKYRVLVENGARTRPTAQEMTGRGGDGPAGHAGGNGSRAPERVSGRTGLNLTVAPMRQQKQA